MKPRRRHSSEFKLDLCSRIDAGILSKAAACREHHLAPSLLDRWMVQFRERGVAAFTETASELEPGRRIAQLEQALGQAYLDIKVLSAALEKKGGLGKP